MSKAYYSKNLLEFLADDNSHILGELTKNHQFTLEEQQRNAWIEEIKILKDQLGHLNSGRILFEYSIPRMGKRSDVIFIFGGFVFIIEFKINEKKYLSSDADLISAIQFLVQQRIVKLS